VQYLIVLSFEDHLAFALKVG